MSSTPSDPIEPLPRHSRFSSTRTERIVILVVVGLVFSSAIWALRSNSPPPNQSMTAESSASAMVLPDKIPLTTGEEPIVEIFTRAGCSVCHTIPGIPGANGRVGPVLALGRTGKQRLSDPAYSGAAKTVYDYVVESVLEPERFIVPGYPGQTMPTWYGSKLSALALEKIARYLEQQTEEE